MSHLSVHASRRLVRPSLLASALLMACALGCAVTPDGVEPSDAVDEGRLSASNVRSARIEAVAQALVVAGRLSVEDSREFVHVRDEQGFSIFRTPAFVAPGGRAVWAIVPPAGLSEDVVRGLPKAAVARITRDGWRSSEETAATPFAFGALTGFSLEVGAIAATTPVECAFRLSESGWPGWLNNDGQNFKTTARTEESLAWTGDLVVSQDGLRRSAARDPLYAGHALTLTLDTYPETPRVRPTVLVQRNGEALPVEVPMAILATGQGSHGKNTRWTATLPSSFVGEGDTLAYWIRVDGPRNTLWESNQGRNHRSAVTAPPKAEWGQAGRFSFTKYHVNEEGVASSGWVYFAGFPSPLSATPSDYQAYAAAPRPAVEVYVPGVTHGAEAQAACGGGFIKVEVWSPFFSGAPNGAWMSHPMDFVATHKNNCRFQWPIRNHAAPMMPPTGVTYAEDGEYPLKFRVSTDGGATYQWLGTEGFPGGGDNLRVAWQNQTYAPSLTVYGSTAFGPVRAGKTARGTFEVINTNNDELVVTSAALEDPQGAFRVTIDGCSALASCGFALLAGARRTVSVAFTPAQPQASYAATLRLSLFNRLSPQYQKGTFAVPLTGERK